MLQLRSIAAASLAAFASLTASAGTIDFEDLPMGNLVNPYTKISDGISVTFTSVNGHSVTNFQALGFPNDNVLFSNSYDLMVTFSSPVNQVIVGNLITGLYTSEVDIITGEAFDSSDNSLGIVTNSDPLHTMTFDNISRVHYTGAATGFAISMLQFPVPTPGAFGVLAAGGLVATRRRR